MKKLYGIPNCDTVKKARVFLEKNKIQYEFIDFKKTPPTIDLIQKWEKVFGELPVNKKGMTYKKYKDEYESLSEKEKVLFLTKETSMIKRPIFEKSEKQIHFGFNEKDYE